MREVLATTGIESEVQWLEDNLHQIQAAKDLLSQYAKVEKKIKAVAEKTHEGVDSLVRGSTGNALCLIDFKPNGHAWTVNESMIHALMSNHNLVNGRRDMLKAMFKATYISKEGASEKVRDEANDLVLQLQAEGFAGQSRQQSPEDAFIKKEAAKAYSCSLKLV